MTRTHPHHPHPDYEALRPHAVALRRAGLSRRQIRDRLGPLGDGALTDLLEGEPPPEWTKRPNAKDDVREQARALRRAGRTYDEIVAELGVSKSSVSLWVRDLPKPTKSPEAMHQMREARWAPYREARDRQIAETKAAAKKEIGTLTDRELFLVGVGLYWAEGGKSKPYDRREKVVFVNSDPGMIQVYLAWLRLLGVEDWQLRFTVMIHESADVAAAERYWADLVGVEVTTLGKTTLKKHNPKTVRKNVGEGYHGCLTVRVLQCTELYRRIEGWWYGIVLGAERAA
ncbi:MULTISPECIES: hypothetical protein [unclassified Streptomyces]|uniref:hypothetical protein n=1 Tax=unclassified Streptomyces TaxID=2593676 RepID=UPI00035DA8E6|nr:MULTISPECIES: hypothetical protein [unclassified Streptomyces]MYT30941.1 hypothetical protein [Streptomyces sp. SID8354]